MVTTLKQFNWFPSKGLNLADPPHLISPEMASDGFDFIVSNNSVLSKRPGFDEVNATALSATPTLNSLTSLSVNCSFVFTNSYFFFFINSLLW